MIPTSTGTSSCIMSSCRKYPPNSVNCSAMGMLFHSVFEHHCGRPRTSAPRRYLVFIINWRMKIILGSYFPLMQFHRKRPIRRSRTCLQTVEIRWATFMAPEKDRSCWRRLRSTCTLDKIPDLWIPRVEVVRIGFGMIIQVIFTGRSSMIRQVSLVPSLKADALHALNFCGCSVVRPIVTGILH
ncbi:unnamed protein product [Amoebophrya sp. A25]|nr:unnamed protein product [Amoebophrya sp. A25]|eukprot:GSA25T00007757001.1